MAVVTLTQIHDVLNIPVADTSHDAELQRYIDAAAATVAYITGPLTATTYTEVRNGGSPVIMLDNPPVLSITSVVEYIGSSAYTLTSQPLGGSSDNYGFDLVDPAAGKLVRRGSNGVVQPFRGSRSSVVITYVAGLLTVPADVQLAVLEDIRGLYQQTQQGSAVGGGSIGSGGGDESYNFGPSHLFPRLNSLLEGPNRTQSIA